MIQTESLKKGFTLIEIYIVVAISAIVGSVVLISFFSFSKEQSLDKSALNIYSAINDSRSRAVSSLDFSDYGVNISSNSVSEFESKDSVETPVGQKYTLGNLVSISNTLGGKIIFNKVTGESSSSGVITVSLQSDPGKTKVITVYNTGIVDIN